MLDALVRTLNARHTGHWGGTYSLNPSIFADVLSFLGLEVVPRQSHPGPQPDTRIEELSRLVRALLSGQEEIKHMSQSISDQIAAASAELAKDVASIKSDLSVVATNMTALKDQIAQLQGSFPPGATVTQEMADALTAAVNDLDSQASALHALAAPPADTVPPVEPTPPEEPAPTV